LNFYRIAQLTEPGQGVFAEHGVLVHHGRDVDVAVDADRGEFLAPAEERVVAGERGEHAEQRGVKAQRVHGPPVLAGGQAERERDVHQAQRGLDVEVEQPAGTRFRVDLGDVEHAEVQIVLAGWLGAT
jgi:hypothetical protein